MSRSLSVRKDSPTPKHHRNLSLFSSPKRKNKKDKKKQLPSIHGLHYFLSHKQEAAPAEQQPEGEKGEQGSLKVYFVVVVKRECKHECKQVYEQMLT